MAILESTGMIKGTVCFLVLWVVTLTAAHASELPIKTCGGHGCASETPVVSSKQNQYIAQVTDISANETTLCGNRRNLCSIKPSWRLELAKALKLCQSLHQTSFGLSFQQCTEAKIADFAPEEQRVPSPGGVAQFTEETIDALFRNFSCSVDDAGSQPVDSVVWHVPRENEAEYRNMGDDSHFAAIENWAIPGYNSPPHLDVRRMASLREAELHCLALDGCYGFSTPTEGHRYVALSSEGSLARGGAKAQVVREGTYIFKRISVALREPPPDDQSSIVHEGWITHIRYQFRYGGYLHTCGYFKGGGDIEEAAMHSVQNAMRKCNQTAECAGFTYKGDYPERTFLNLKDAATVAVGPSSDGAWHSFARLNADCDEEMNILYHTDCPVPAAANASSQLRASYVVDILRPGAMLVAVAHDFASDEECADMIKRAGEFETYEPAQVNDRGANGDAPGKAAVSLVRRAYSAGLNPNLLEKTDILSEFQFRQFALVRNLTGYKLWPAGQEPLNVVLYKDAGDEYRPHCDGNCADEVHRTGLRVLTSIMYCETAISGGQTSFKHHLKVVPKKNDLLIFAYKYSNGTMDLGHLSEHSGCPLMEGRKIIVTQWFREGVTPVKNWNHWSSTHGIN